MPVLSIITPTFNSAPYIRECVQNVAEQQCGQIEHIIVDGGSTDGTVAAIKELADQYAHIRWVSEKDQGQSDAMNKGIRLAKGAFIGFLNVDDLYEFGLLNRVASIMQKPHPVPTLLLGKTRQVDEKERVLLIQNPVSLDLEYVIRFWRPMPFPANPVAYFYHKKLHEIIGEYDIHQHYTMDYDFFLRASPVVHVERFDEIWGTYRMMPGTKTVEMLKKGGSKKTKEKLFFRYIRRISWEKRYKVWWEYIYRYKANRLKHRLGGLLYRSKQYVLRSCLS